MDRDEERRIIAQVCAGDTNAFEALVVAYQKQVYNLALRTVGNEEDAADMTQEVFLRAYRALGTFRGESKFSVWLYRLTTNVCIDFLRSRRRHPTVSLTASEDDDEQPQFDLPADESVGPEQQLTRSEMRRSVARGLDSLPDDARKILILRELDGLSYAEIGKVLRLEAGTVKSRLFRARRRLCDFLLADGNLPDRYASKQTKGGADGRAPVNITSSRSASCSTANCRRSRCRHCAHICAPAANVSAFMTAFWRFRPPSVTRPPRRPPT